jgi:archaellum component FlaC
MRILRIKRHVDLDTGKESTRAVDEASENYSDSAVSEEEIDAVEEEDPSIFQRLRSEEAALLKEKQTLILLKEKLDAKVKKEITLKKNNIQKLKTEITDLKVTCEELTRSFNPT